MKLWQPSNEQIDNALVTEFIRRVNKSFDLQLTNFHELYDWSCDNPESFWTKVLTFTDCVFEGTTSPALVLAEKFYESTWFPNLKLNYAENLLQGNGRAPAILFQGEGHTSTTVSWDSLRARVAAVLSQFQSLGIKKGDRVAAIVPNVPETIIAMLACTALGATWSSASPDFGVQGIADRFEQIEPKVLLTCNGYTYKEKEFLLSEKLQKLLPHLPSVQHVVEIPYVGSPLSLPSGTSVTLHRLTEELGDLDQHNFTRFDFDHPLFIMFSSGTTGKPKCIVHTAGGTLLEHKKELVLHGDVREGERIFYSTTCGWMMWNWLVSALSCKATVVLYDGFPMLREGQVLFDLADEAEISVFGTSAGFVSAINKMGLKPKDSHSLTSVRALLSTGSPLVPESFDYLYSAVKEDWCVSSISGGTDILGCFALGSTVLPVHRGELQTRSLGLAVKVYDENGEEVVGSKGELVCTAPFPSMPLCFWNDADKSRYHSAYFNRFDNIWCHGDYVELTQEKGMIFYGRSDAVLNPGGVRIGTAEIYRQLETIPEIQEAVVVGQRWKDDERVVLFVTLSESSELTDSLKSTISSNIRKKASPRHVPAKIIAVADIPKTRSGKISELAIKKVIHGEAVKNTEALANPESLQLYEKIVELQG